MAAFQVPDSRRCSTEPTDSPAGNVGMGTTAQQGSNPGALDPTVGVTADGTTYNVGQGMRTDDAEDLGDGAGAFNEMAFSIEKVTVTAKSRALKGRVLLGTGTRPQGNPRIER